jgi:hypothetical protein
VPGRSRAADSTEGGSTEADAAKAGATATAAAIDEHPRPQLVRPAWVSLDGPWQFWGAAANDRRGDRRGRHNVDEPPVGRRLPWRVQVPFAVEWGRSGIGAAYERMWYRRTVRVPPGWAADRDDPHRVHLHFGAVDWECRVWVNGVEVGAHRGGYDAFSFDITPQLTWGEEELLVHVSDPTDGGAQPLGKQRRHPGGIFYTSVSGIWQTVWLERTPSRYVSRLELTPDLAAGTVQVVAHAVDAGSGSGSGSGAGLDPAAPVRVEVRAGLGRGDATVATATGTSGRPFAVEIPNVRAWSPADPFLYGVTVTLADGSRPDHAGPGDRVDSYVGMRSIELAEVAGEPRPLLNGRFLFQLGLLDQGYWPDGGYTAPTDEALRRDIEITKELGFNVIRKHAKVEPARWYHWADRLGVLVWQDMPSMPHDRVPDGGARAQFEAELAAVVEQCSAFPSVVGWVPFNEGWGQYDVGRIAAAVRAMDPTRLVSENSGSADARNQWIDAAAGHVADLHDYPGPAVVAPSPGRCRALGEFGGLGLAVAGHTWRAGDGFSYEWAESRDRLTDRYLGMIDELRTLARDQGLSIAIYTQTTDVEGEYNGLLTYDRAVLKVDLDRVRAAHERLIAEAG